MIKNVGMVSIVIPNWNGEKKLKQNLPQVLKVRGVDEIIVVDDGSDDGSVNLIKSEFPNINLIKKDKNSGFSSTVNRGVKNCKGDLVFLLNNDAVPSHDCVEKVLKYFKNSKVFSVGFNTGGSWAWAKFHDGFFWHGQSGEKPNEAHQTLWVSGGSGIFRKSIWEELKGLDELFDPFYEEDVDLGYRATKRGYINLWDPSAKVEHYKQKGVIEENFSKEYITKIAQRNQLIFIWKNITNPDLIRQHIIALVRKIIFHPKYWSVFIQALGVFVTIVQKRKDEKLQAKLTDQEILNAFHI